ncbi:hypothetical protein ACQ86D_01145 [Streptomyces galilaeus]
MSGLLVLDRRQTAAALRPDAVLDAVGRALVSIARDEVPVPPRIAALTPTGLLGAMPGYVPGLGLAAKLVTVTADPRHPGRRFRRGLVALFDEHDGRPLALVDGESLTEVRTAAVAIRSALALAVRPGLGRAAVVGTGAQARAARDGVAGGRGDGGRPRSGTGGCGGRAASRRPGRRRCGGGRTRGRCGVLLYRRHRTRRQT